MSRVLRMTERPVVRHFSACERIDRSPDEFHTTLSNVIHVIRPLPGHGYPRIHPELGLFAMLTNGRGMHTLTVELTVGVGPGAQQVYQTRSVTIDLGADPLMVHGFPIRLRNLPFPHPGQYELVLLCDNEPLAHELIELRDSRCPPDDRPRDYETPVRVHPPSSWNSPTG